MTVVSIADLLPPKRKVEISTGKFLEVRGLSTEELVKLGATHKQLLMELFVKKGAPDYTAVIASSPTIAIDVVSVASEAGAGQEEAIKRIPAGAMALVLQAVWEETFPNPKAVMALFESMAKGMHSVELAVPPVNAQSRSNSGLPAQPITSSRTATH